MGIPGSAPLDSGGRRDVQPVAIIYGGDAPSGPIVGYQQLTNTQLATVQSLTVPAGTTTARVQDNGSQPVRWRADGTPPTATVGMRITGGGDESFVGDLTALRFIREADGATLDITYYG